MVDCVKYPSGTEFQKYGKTVTIMGYIYYGSCGLYYLVMDCDGYAAEYHRDEIDEFFEGEYCDAL